MAIFIIGRPDAGSSTVDVVFLALKLAIPILTPNGTVVKEATISLHRAPTDDHAWARTPARVVRTRGASEFCGKRFGESLRRSHCSGR